MFDRKNQLSILMEHPNTEINIIDEPVDVGFKMPYRSIGSIKSLLDMGDHLKVYKTKTETEPHGIVIHGVSGKPIFALDLKTAPIATWKVYRKDNRFPGALRDAPEIDTLEFQAPIDGALLERETHKAVASWCKARNRPFKFNKTSFCSMICHFKYHGLKGEYIGFSTTDTEHHWIGISPVSNLREIEELEKETSPQIETQNTHASGLEAAYGHDEPEYTSDNLITINPDYEKV